MSVGSQGAVANTGPVALALDDIVGLVHGPERARAEPPPEREPPADQPVLLDR